MGILIPDTQSTQEATRAISVIIYIYIQNAETLGINKIVTKMMCKHWQSFEKFGLSVEKIALDISSAK